MASSIELPAQAGATVLDALCARFPAIGRETWRDRIARGRVLDAAGAPVTERTPCGAGCRIRYYREVPAERAIPFQETVLYADGHLLAADKPHFLPVTPAGGYVEETLLARLVRRTGNADLVPLHRIDRGTAGIVLFSTHRATREAYHALFRERRIAKRYEALAPALPRLRFPLVRESRLVRGDPFLRMRETEGVPNAATRIDVLEREGAIWRYALEPITGRKHQLRVHMAALGAPIVNDDLYATADLGGAGLADDGAAEAAQFAHPLELLARSLAFTDPLSGRMHRFESRFELGRTAD